jgi:MinD-like ATPase involved in chromosome partitioning or flagellar assembly
MHTISFYSYKGGVGRSLVVANVAKYLSQFGQNVFVIDFDLEAPGLHYKLALGSSPLNKIRSGLVDYLYEAIANSANQPLDAFVVEIPIASSEGRIWLLPAGAVPSSIYWHKLARINWHDLFYSDSAPGIPLFLDLKDKIETKYAPDFLLIDSRTGITEIGGVATTILPDTLVALLMYNRENLDGIREVLRSVQKAPRLKTQRPIKIFPVLTRIPVSDQDNDDVQLSLFSNFVTGTEDPTGHGGQVGPVEDLESRLANSVRSFLNEPADDLEATLEIPKVFVLHSEPSLEISETLRIGGGLTPEQSQLLQDYLALFSKLLPKQIIDPKMTTLIGAAVSRAFDDPDGSQRTLEALTSYYPHPDGLKSLIKLYRLRNDEENVLWAANRYWALTGESSDPLLWDVVKNEFEEVSDFEGIKYSLDFIEAIWRANGASDVEIGTTLAESYVNADNRQQAAFVLCQLIDNAEPDEGILAQYLKVLVGLKDWKTAFQLLEKHQSAINNFTFFEAVAQMIIKFNDAAEGARFLEKYKTRIQELKDKRPASYARLLAVSAQPNEALSFMTNSIRELGRKRQYRLIQAFGPIFRELGKFSDFEELVNKIFPSRVAGEILAERNPTQRSHVF